MISKLANISKIPHDLNLVHFVINVNRKSKALIQIWHFPCLKTITNVVSHKIVCGHRLRTFPLNLIIISLLLNVPVKTHAHKKFFHIWHAAIRDKISYKPCNSRLLHSADFTKKKKREKHRKIEKKTRKQNTTQHNTTQKKLVDIAMDYLFSFSLPLVRAHSRSV